jgi:hypothetical protein
VQLTRAAALVLLLGCGSGERGGRAELVVPREACPIGDLDGAPELTLLVRGPDGRAVPAGARVPLIEPPQGGQVIFAGVRAKNLDGSGLEITGSLRELGAEAVLSFDTRLVNLTVVDGWGEPGTPEDISTFANIPACPNAALSEDVQERAHVLEIALRDRRGKHATASLEVIPTCSQPELAQLCACECSKEGTAAAACVHARASAE